METRFLGTGTVERGALTTLKQSHREARGADHPQGVQPTAVHNDRENKRLDRRSSSAVETCFLGTTTTLPELRDVLSHQGADSSMKQVVELRRVWHW